MRQIMIEGITQAAYDRLARDLSTMIETGAGSLMLRTYPAEEMFDYTIITRPEIVVITTDRVSLNMRSSDGLDISMSIRHNEYNRLVF